MFISTLYFLKLSIHQKATSLSRVNPRRTCSLGLCQSILLPRDGGWQRKTKFKKGLVPFECKLSNQEVESLWDAILSFAEPETIPTLQLAREKSQDRNFLAPYILEPLCTGLPGATGWVKSFLCPLLSTWGGEVEENRDPARVEPEQNYELGPWCSKMSQKQDILPPRILATQTVPSQKQAPERSLLLKHYYLFRDLKSIYWRYFMHWGHKQGSDNCYCGYEAIYYG